MTTDPDRYFIDGCGRCPLFATPQCKVRKWEKELKDLRKIILATGLKEEAKWGMPCYTHEGKNILILSAFKEYCAVSFFKGSLLKDPHGILVQPTENSSANRMFRFTDLEKITELVPFIKDYITEAVEIEKAGLKVESRPVNNYPIPHEFQAELDRDPVLKAAFYELTPGRQKGYLLHFSQPKQSKTREARIEKCIPRILDGIGLNDRF